VTDEGQRIREVVKRGTWLYGGAVPCEVHIFETNYSDAPPIIDDPDINPDYPPRDNAGNFYFAVYFVRGQRRGVSNCFGSVEDAQAAVAAVVGGTLKWLP